MALVYNFFAMRGVGTNGASVQVFKKNFYFDDINKNKGFLSDLRTDFFDNILTHG